MLIDTMHRDAVAALFSPGAIRRNSVSAGTGIYRAQRLADGTLVLEDPTFDALSGRFGPRRSRFTGAVAAFLATASTYHQIELFDR